MKIITVLPDVNNPVAKSAKSKNHSFSKITNILVHPAIKEISYNPGKPIEKAFAIAKITFGKRKAKASSIMPFRVRFSNLANIGYSADNPAPIGIAVIERNNYVF